jgi:hypothetical protein
MPITCIGSVSPGCTTLGESLVDIPRRYPDMDIHAGYRGVDGCNSS